MTDKTHQDSGFPIAYSHYATYAEYVEALHARIAELEAQLEAIGAGGVSGPLMGQPQEMPDLSALTERGAQAWAGVDAQGLRDGFSAADMATASAQGFRDGVASLSVSAVSEPVARADSWTNDQWIDLAQRHANADWDSDTPDGYLNAVKALCNDFAAANPSPPEGIVAEQALRKVLSVVQRYLPPDGPTAHDAMTEITEIVDPWPLGPLEKP